MDTSQNGDKSKTATTKTATNPIRRQTKRATEQNGDTPKRRQTKTAILQNGDNQNGDTSKTATRQNGDTSKTACGSFGYNQTGDNSKTATIQLIQSAVLTCIQNSEQKLRVAVLDLSPFWRVAVLDTTKTATNPKRQHVKTATIQLDYLQNLSQFKTATYQSGVCRRFDVSPFWIYRRFGVSPFWIQPKRRQVKTATIQLYLFIKLFQIQDGDIPKRCMSPF